MEKKQAGQSKNLAAILAIAGWFALIAQFYIHMHSNAAPAPELVIRYFSYFTIVTNLITAYCFLALWLFPGSGHGRFFARQQTLAAITVYMIVVGLIYNLVLRFIWNPQGLQRVVDELLHLIIPVLTTVYWFVFVPKDRLAWKNAWSWLLYPLGYAVIIFIRGSFSGFYPYPFIDMGKLGLQKTAVNTAGITLLFFALSLLLIAIGKMTSRKKNSS